MFTHKFTSETTPTREVVLWEKTNNIPAFGVGEYAECLVKESYGK